MGYIINRQTANNVAKSIYVLSYQSPDEAWSGTTSRRISFELENNEVKVGHILNGFQPFLVELATGKV